MGIIWIFIIAIVAVIIYYAIANRSRKEVAEETETPEKTPALPNVSEAPPAETEEKKEAEGSPSPPPPPSPPPAP